MTARSLRVKRSVLAAVKTSGSGGKSPNNAPSKPSVTSGPKFYGRTKTGRSVVVPRFYVTRHRGKRLYDWLKVQDNWFVFDFKEDDLAEGTAANGYRSKKVAIRAAEEVRDKAKIRYARSPF